MVDLGMVVESRFSSRRQIVSDLRDSELVRTVIEAQSVADGLEELKLQPFSACLIGPSVSEPVAVNFIRQGKAHSVAKSCAFVVVVENNAKSIQTLLRAGADATLKQPYMSATFSEVVRGAVKGARERALELSPTKHALQALAIAPLALKQLQATGDASLAEILETTASGLRSVARDITIGRLKLKNDGTPSMATRDALRLVFENALYPEADVQQIGTLDHLFASALVQWFVDRVRMDHAEATEILRVTLLRLAGEQAEVSA